MDDQTTENFKWLEDDIDGSILMAQKGMEGRGLHDWEPKEGEWCIFWDRRLNIPNTEDKLIVAKYGKTHEVGKARGLHSDTFGDRHMMVAPAIALPIILDYLEEK